MGCIPYIHNINDLAQYRDYERYRASQYIFLMTQIGTYKFKVILSFESNVKWVKELFICGGNASYLYRNEGNARDILESSARSSGDFQ